jgi:uncharacterized protein (TIGR03089 family)
MAPLIADVFRARRLQLGGAPLITYYDLDSGERTELSAVSLGNWVDKTSNLLVDELLIESTEQVELEVARSHPGHWMTFIWELACWQVGAVVTLGAASHARVLVLPPEATWLASAHTQVVVCSLHPLGLGLPTPPPEGALDYTVEVRTQGDRYVGTPISPHVLAWWESAAERQDARSGDAQPAEAQPSERRLTQAELTDRPVLTAQRLLIRPASAWAGASALIDAVLSGGSLVVVTGQDDGEKLRHVAEQERVDAVIAE